MVVCLLFNWAVSPGFPVLCGCCFFSFLERERERASAIRLSFLLPPSGVVQIAHFPAEDFPGPDAVGAANQEGDIACFRGHRMRIVVSDTPHPTFPLCTTREQGPSQTRRLGPHTRYFYFFLFLGS